MLPVFLDMTDRLALVVGGGPVGRRKALAVRAAGGRVRLVCLEGRPTELADADLEWRQAPFAAEHLDGVNLVFAAATAVVNATVTEEALRRGLWVNVADEPRRGNFHLGACVRRGGLVVSVGTGGAAPAVAGQVRRRLEAQFDDAYGAWVALLAELRPLVLAIPDAERRRVVFARLAEWEWLERIRQEGMSAVGEAMRGILGQQDESARYEIRAGSVSDE